MVTFELAKSLGEVFNDSVLGPVLFKIFISNLEKEVNCGFLNFRDDSKVFWKVKYHAGGEDCQKDLSEQVGKKKKWISFRVDD